ncbi:hypothetical protein TREES_T100014803 [Tupaia chinensis]|uniref:Uncharacterized protein n=1 Tax=Tupaia chinensis TaxID=246437 RepID=L9KUI1_TUPCH|nr:hypothetical protein TREES_T100014803 [Tupaia chinensis]
MCPARSGADRSSVSVLGRIIGLLLTVTTKHSEHPVPTFQKVKNLHLWLTLDMQNNELPTAGSRSCVLCLVRNSPSAAPYGSPLPCCRSLETQGSSVLRKLLGRGLGHTFFLELAKPRSSPDQRYLKV